MVLPGPVSTALAEGGRLFRMSEETSMPPLARYPEHNDIKFQSDLVTRFRVAVRLWLARTGSELWRGREDRAIKAATQAGRYYAEYRRHYKHLKGLPGMKGRSR